MGRGRGRWRAHDLGPRRTSAEEPEKEPDNRPEQHGEEHLQEKEEFV